MLSQRIRNVIIKGDSCYKHPIVASLSLGKTFKYWALYWVEERGFYSIDKNDKEIVRNQCISQPGISSYKTMAYKLMYIPNDDIQIKSFCGLKWVV